MPCSGLFHRCFPCLFPGAANRSNGRKRSAAGACRGAGRRDDRAPLARAEHWSGATIKKTGQGEIGIEVPDKTAALHTGPWVARKMTVETTGARGVGVLLDKTGVSLTLEEAAITSSGDLGLDSSY